jgi:hypothetical protein
MCQSASQINSELAFAPVSYCTHGPRPGGRQLDSLHMYLLANTTMYKADMASRRVTVVFTRSENA